MRFYESLALFSEHFSTNQKKSFLESAVQPVKALRSVKDQADKLEMHNKKSLSRDEYSALVEDASANFDANFKNTSKRLSRIFCQQEVFEDNDNNSDTEHDTDLPISSIQSNFTKITKERAPSKSHLPAEK